MKPFAQQIAEHAEEYAARYGEQLDDAETDHYLFKRGWHRSKPCLSPLDPFVALDFETTGLSCEHHEIIEIGAVRVLPYDLKQQPFHRLIHPSTTLPRHIVRLTGIDNELLAREGVNPSEALDALLEFVGDTPVVAYNAPFDLGFLNAACARYKAVTQDAEHSCALALARRVWPNLANHKLNFVADRLGLATPDAHRALGDAARTANVYRAAMIEYYGLHHLTSGQNRDRLRAMHQ